MKITSIFMDIYFFLSSLIAEEPIDILWGGETWFLCILISAAVFFILYKTHKLGGIKALLAVLTVTVYSYYYVAAIFPLELVGPFFPFSRKMEGAFLSIFWKPFYGFTGLGHILGVYWRDMVFFLVMGFAFTLVFRFAYKLQWFSVFAAGSMVFYIALIVIVDLASGGIAKMMDLSLPIVCPPMMFIGWGLARLVIHLNRGIYDRIQQIEQTEAV